MMVFKWVTWVVVIVILTTTHSLNRIFIPIMVVWVVDMVFKTDTLSPNFKIQLPLRILMGAFKRLVLVVYMVLWTATLIFNRTVWNNWWIITIGMNIYETKLQPMYGGMFNPYVSYETLFFRDDTKFWPQRHRP